MNELEEALELAPPRQENGSGEAAAPAPPAPATPPGPFSSWRSPLSIRETIAIVAFGFSMVAAGSVAWERVSNRLDRIAELLLQQQAQGQHRDTRMVDLGDRLQKHIDAPGHAVGVEEFGHIKYRLGQLERRLDALEGTVYQNGRKR